MGLSEFFAWQKKKREKLSLSSFLPRLRRVSQKKADFIAGAPEFDEDER